MTPEVKHDIVAILEAPQPFRMRGELVKYLGTVPEITAPPHLPHTWLCKWHGIDIYTDTPRETLIEVIKELSNQQQICSNTN